MGAPRTSFRWMRSARRPERLAEVVNLRMARKRAARARDEERANRNRAVHGRNKVDRVGARLDAERTDRTLDGAKRERDQSPDT